MDSLCHVKNKMMYLLLWRTVSALTWVWFWYLFPSLQSNSGNKHQNNPLMNAETARHSSTYIIIPPHNEVVGGYIGFTPSISPSIKQHWKINCCVGRSTVLLEDKLYYWKINCDVGRSGIFSEDAVMTINRNRWKLPIKENNCKKMTT